MMKRKPETLRVDEEWMIVSLPRETAKALISFMGMSRRKIPQNPITETGLLRSGITVEIGRAIGELLAEESVSNEWHNITQTPYINFTPSGEYVGVPVIINRSKVNIFFGEESITEVLCAIVSSKTNRSALSANAPEQSLASHADAVIPSVSPNVQAKSSRNPWKIASFALLVVMALIGCAALVGVVINSASTGGNGIPVSNASPAAPLNIEQQAPQISAITTSSAPMPPPADLEVVLGNGGKRLFVFDDPLCPYCKRLEPSLRAMAKRGYEVHIFPTPIHDDARALVAGIACAKNKEATWADAINKEIPSAATCDRYNTAPDAALAFFRQFGFNATPTMINDAGRVKVGGFESDDALAVFIEEK